MKIYNNFLNRLKNKKSEESEDKIVIERQCPHCATRGSYNFKFLDKQKQSADKQNDEKN